LNKREPLRSLEFVVEGTETTLVVETIRAAGGDRLERITVAPVDGTPRCRVIAALTGDSIAAVMRAVMNALDKTG
jgi:hypothetical protein